MNDVKNNYPEYIKEIIDKTHLDIESLSYYLKALAREQTQGKVNVRVQNIPTNIILVKLEYVPLTRIENGNIVLEEFKTITK